MLRLTTVMLFLCLVLFQLSETKRSKSSIVSKTGIKSIKGKSFKGKTNPKGSEIKWQKQATMGRRRRSGKRKTKRLKIRKRNRNARYFRQKLNLCKNKKRKCWRKNSNRKKKKRNKRGRGKVKRKNGSKKGQKKKRSAAYHCSMVQDIKQSLGENHLQLIIDIRQALGDNHLQVVINILKTRLSDVSI